MYTCANCYDCAEYGIDDIYLIAIDFIFIFNTDIYS